MLISANFAFFLSKLFRLFAAGNDAFFQRHHVILVLCALFLVVTSVNVSLCLCPRRNATWSSIRGTTVSPRWRKRVIQSGPPKEFPYAVITVYQHFIFQASASLLERCKFLRFGVGTVLVPRAETRMNF